MVEGLTTPQRAVSGSERSHRRVVHLIEDTVIYRRYTTTGGLRVEMGTG